jgi:serine/threonine-protein kinase HipA
MENKCLYCYEPVEPGHDLHKKCALEFYGTPKPPLLEYSLDQMNELAKNVVERSVSVPGVQAKLSLSVVKETMEKSDTRLTVMDALGGRYIFKPPVDRYPEMPQNEHVTAKIAQTYGIRVVPASLIRLASGELSYITKRVDRKETGEKIHMLDMFQITEAFDKYKSSMEKVGKALDNYSDNTVLDKLFYFELALFSFLSGNNDMHLKNFSMIESPSGWVLAPAYDLLNVTILNPEDDEELALTLAGKKKKLKREHFEQLGKGLGLTDRQLEATYKRFVKNKPVAIDLLNRSFLSDTMKMAYIDVLERRYKQLELNV